MSSISFPFSSFPRGWFQIGFSHELKSGEVKAVEYFDEKLVMWRGESGKVFVQDAFCLHLGANRGIGGSVCGDDLVCPWHGWQWDGDGCNTLIPYSSEGCKPKVKIKTYRVREWCGGILAWYDWAGGEPTWEPPAVPQFDDPEWYPAHPFSEKYYRIRSHPQMPMENWVDVHHMPYIHGTSEPPQGVGFCEEGHYFRSDIKVFYGGGHQRTGVTPDGAVHAVMTGECYGIGLSVASWDEPLVPTVMVVNITPVDGEKVDYFFQQTSKRDPGEIGDEPVGRALEMMKMQWRVIEQDFPIWENMKYLPHATFATEEAKLYAAFRRWAQQFYPSEA